MKFLNLNKSYGYVLVTLLCLVFLGATYFFIYLPRNEKVIEEQRFRTLQNIDKNIHLKIENSTSLIKNLMEVDTSNANDPVNSKEHLNTYINNYPKDNFTLSSIDTLKNLPKKNRDSIKRLPNLIIDDWQKNIILRYKKDNIQKKTSDTLVMEGAINFTFKQFFNNLLPDAVFDEYIVFGKNSTLFESFPSGISKPKEDSLLNIKNGIGGSYSRDITVGGKDFKLFLQPINFDTTNKWILSGLLSKKRYNQERSNLPPEIIMLLVTAVLAMIIIFPWIKLYQMGSKDRLTLMDGASSIVVAMLLMSMLFFCFFKYNTSVRSNGSPDSKKILSEKIKTAFYNETKTMYSLMEAYDSFRMKHANIADIGKNEQGKLTIRDTAGIKFNKLWDDATKEKDTLSSLLMPKIDQVFWMDKEGVEKYNWTTKRMNAPHGNFEKRAYVNHIVNKKYYYLDGNPAKKFYLDQVISWVTGSFQSVIAIPVKENGIQVGAISFTMRSLQDVVLPTGYSFAIINNDAQVLYHSISSRNLNENLKSEFLDSANILSYITAKTEGDFATRYYSKDYVINISPIKNLPYFIVIFSDSSFSDSRNYEVYSFTFSMLLLLFLIILAQFCITMLLSSRRSFFKKQLFDTSWIGPKMYSHHDYLISFVFNGLIIVTLIICFKQMLFLPYLYLLLSTFTIAPLCLNKLFAKRYEKQNKENNRRFKLIAIRYLKVLLVIINISAGYVLESKHFWTNLGIEAILIFIGLLFTNKNFTNYLFTKSVLILDKKEEKNTTRLINLSKKQQDIKTGFEKYVFKSIRDFLTDTKYFLVDNNRNYIRTFSLMALTGLIITSGIPVAFFYFTSYNYEQNLGVRQRQTDYANRLIEHPGFTVDSNKNGLLIYDTTGIYTDSSWIDGFPSIINDSTINKSSAEDEYNYTRKILNNFHLKIGGNSIQTDKLYIPYANDSSVIYQPLRINTTGDSSITTFKQTNIVDKYLELNSFNLNYRLPGIFRPIKALVYWLFLFFALVIFYFIIINILRKLFSLNLPNVEVWAELDKKILADNKLNNLLFIIGLPGAGKINYIKEEIKKGKIIYLKGDQKVTIVYDEKNRKKNNVFIADLMQMPDTGAEIEKDEIWKDLCAAALDDRNCLVIINHFEYNIQDQYTNLAKLNLLEQLMLKNKSKIMVLSTVHPISFLDSLNEVSKKLEIANQNPDSNQKNNEPIAKRSYDLERWTVLLGHYRIIIVKIKKETNNNNNIESGKQLISRETDSTLYLSKMQKSTLNVMTDYSSKNGLKEKDLQKDLIKNWVKNDMMERADELAYKLQVTSHYFYMYIWQSLTKEEKFLLYDLAEDNLVNSYDNYNLTMLMAKGVILQPNGQLQFFNKGFKNFILTAIGNTEAMKIKDRIKENGNWSKLRTPFLIVILAILSFLFISQQEAYSKLIAYAVALSAGIPTVLKVFSLFDKNATKANT